MATAPVSSYEIVQAPPAPIERAERITALDSLRGFALLGILLMSSLLVIVVNLVIDLLYAVLDPRIELR